MEENTMLETGAEVVDNSTESVEPATESTADAQPQATLKINYMGEDREITLEEAKTLAQKGYDYDRQRERWDSTKPLLENLDKVARDYGWTDDHGHGDVNAFIEAMKEAKKQEEIEALQQGTQLPKELAEELYLSRLERQQREAQAKELEQNRRKEQENMDFLNYFKEVNGRTFEATDTIPNEVIVATQNGIPLKYAYAEYLSRNLLSDKKIEAVNQQNAESAVGSVNGQGVTIEKEFFTSEEIDRFTKADYDNNPGLFEKVKKSMSMLYQK